MAKKKTLKIKLKEHCFIEDDGYGLSVYRQKEEPNSDGHYPKIWVKYPKDIPNALLIFANQEVLLKHEEISLIGYIEEYKKMHQEIKEIVNLKGES